MPPSVRLNQGPSITQSSHRDTNIDDQNADSMAKGSNRNHVRKKDATNSSISNKSTVSRTRRRKRDSKLSAPQQKASEENAADSSEPIAHEPTAAGAGLANYSYGGMGMGMGMGMGLMSPYSSPYGMMGMGMPTTGPLASFNQLIFGFQSVVFSLGQAMQIVGMNTHALHQLYEQGMTMLDNVFSTLHEINTLESASQKHLSEEDKKRRRRLKAIRWSMLIGISYVGYRFVANWIKKRREYKRMLREGIHSNVTQTTGSSMIPRSRNWPQQHNNQYTSGWDSNQYAHGWNDGGLHNMAHYGGQSEPFSPYSRIRPNTMYPSQY